MIEETDEVVVYTAPRGTWDFTDAQRIIIALLLWLNIIVLVMAVLAVMGYLTA